MVVDILMALVFVLILELFSIISDCIKQIVILCCCFTAIFIYFMNGQQINFVGETNLAIWVIFAIIFEIAISIITKLWKKHIGK